MDVYVARDRNKDLLLHFQKPVYNNITFDTWDSKDFVIVNGSVLDNIYKDLTFEDGPISLNMDIVPFHI